MRVIADLHGGDPDDAIAKAEFREIKDKVLVDVRIILYIRLRLRLFDFQLFSSKLAKVRTFV